MQLYKHTQKYSPSGRKRANIYNSQSSRWYNKIGFKKTQQSATSPHIPAPTPQADTTPFPESEKNKKTKISCFSVKCRVTEALHPTAPSAPSQAQLYPTLPELQSPPPYDIQSLKQKKKKTTPKTTPLGLWDPHSLKDDSYQWPAIIPQVQGLPPPAVVPQVQNLGPGAGGNRELQDIKEDSEPEPVPEDSASPKKTHSASKEEEPSTIPKRITRSTKDGNKHVTTTPMIEVAGPQRPQLVFRVWEPNILLGVARQHMPAPEKGGKAVYDALVEMVATTRPTLFELKEILITIYGIAVVSCLGNSFARNYRLHHPDYNNAANNDYTGGITGLENPLIQALPINPQYSAIKDCVQRPNEKPNEYYQRLLEVFKVHSDIEEPNNWADAGRPGPFETILCQAFLEGLHEDIRGAVKQSYIGWNDQCRMVTLRQHANHAYKNHQEKEGKSKKRKDKLMEDAQLTLLQAATSSMNISPTPRFQQQQRREPPPDQYAHQSTGSRGACFICGATDHWARACPTKRLQESRGRGFHGQRQNFNCRGPQGPHGGFSSHG